jgi:hypothetical protein
MGQSWGSSLVSNVVDHLHPFVHTRAVGDHPSLRFASLRAPAHPPPLVARRCLQYPRVFDSGRLARLSKHPNMVMTLLNLKLLFHKYSTQCFARLRRSNAHIASLARYNICTFNLRSILNAVYYPLPVSRSDSGSTQVRSNKSGSTLEHSYTGGSPLGTLTEMSSATMLLQRCYRGGGRARQ